jgi:hypothetical protein
MAPTTSIHGAGSSPIQYTSEASAETAPQSPSASNPKRPDERFPTSRAPLPVQAQSSNIRRSDVLPKTPQHLPETTGPSPEVIKQLEDGKDPREIIRQLGIPYDRAAIAIMAKAGEIKQEKARVVAQQQLMDGKDPQEIISQLGINPYCSEATDIKNKAYEIKQEKAKVAAQKLENMKSEYPQDDWNNRVFMGRSDHYDPPAAALKRGTLEDVIKQFHFENDADEIARLTKLKNGGQARNEMWWS